MSLSVSHRPDQHIGPHRFLGNGRWEMGCYDPAGQVAPESLLHRAYRPGGRFCLGVAAPPAGRPEQVLNRALYGGMIFDHFGHFVTESLARLWPAAEDPELPLILTQPQRMQVPRLAPWQDEILALLGLGGRIVMPRGPLKVRDCLIPEPGYEIQFTCAPEQARFLARVPWRPERGRKLWLSRAGLEGRGGNDGGRAQEAIDSALQRAGWSVIRPETLPLPAQLAEYARAERIAGEEGSALHGVLFLKDCVGLRMDMMIRDPEQPLDRVNANQSTICAAKGIILNRHRIAGEALIRREGAHVQKTYAEPAAYVAALADQG